MKRFNDLTARRSCFAGIGSPTGRRPVATSVLTRSFVTLLLVALSLALLPKLALADPLVPAITINTSSSGEVTNSEIYSGLKLSMLLSALVFLPSLFMGVTCFTRISVVLATARQALGTAQTPPNQVILGLSMFLTFAVMGPIFEKIYTTAIVPYSEDQIDHKEAFQKAYAPLREFMLRHTREADLGLFLEVQHMEPPDSPDDLGPTVVVPAFMVSELNSAFQIAFLIYIPFLVLDMIISSVLTSMSMITLPPTVISLPIKMMLFVIVDGWHLIIGNLIKSYSV